MTTLRREAREITTLATPVVITQLGSMMSGVVDLLMLGHFSTESFASASVARVWFPTFRQRPGVDGRRGHRRSERRRLTHRSPWSGNFSSRPSSPGKNSSPRFHIASAFSG